MESSRKRISDHDSPSRSKRSRSRYDIDDPRDRESPPEYEYRSRGRAGAEGIPPPFEYEYEPRRYRTPERDSYDRYRNHSSSRRSDSKPSYRTLCVSNISSKISDSALKDQLSKEFSKFGEFSIKIQSMGDQRERVAYVNFRYAEDARAAKHARVKLLLYERQVVIDAVRSRERRRTRSPSPTFFPSRDISDPHLDHAHDPGFAPHVPPYLPPPLPPGLPPPIPYNRPGMPLPIPTLPPPGPGPIPGRPHIMPPGPSRPPMPGPPPPHNHEFIPHQLPPREPPPFRPFEAPMPGLPPVRPENREPLPGADRMYPHMAHLKPEDDVKATRTLFVGNLDPDMTPADLRRIFDKYGQVEDIDIKRPQQGNGNAYAFVKYFNLDYSHRAKIEMSGCYIGRYQCKIGYGKPQPTCCVWVGGLGPWITKQDLEKEFDRFGIITQVEWPYGKSYAYILYGNIEAAQEAITKMRGAPLGGPDRRLRLDFSDASHMNGQMYKGYANANPPPNPQWPPGVPPQLPPPAYDRGRNWPPPNSHPPPNHHHHVQHNDRRGKFDYRDRSPEERRYSDDKRKDYNPYDVEMKKVSTMNELSNILPVSWNGALILKNNAFPAQMHVVSGDRGLVDKLMKASTTKDPSIIRITQRLRLDDSKLDDVSKRITTVGPNGHCILIALPTSVENKEFLSQTETQQRPLKNLISYLNKKDAAGVVSLPPNVDEKDHQGILYAFPPCSFGYDLLRKKAPGIRPESKEDHLMVVAVQGTA